MRLIKQSTATNIMVLLTSNVDHITGIDALTPNVYLSKDCGAFALITPVTTNIGNGWYKIELTTTHTNTIGDLVIHIEDASADPTDVLMSVKSQLIEDIYTLLNTTSQTADDILLACGDIPQILTNTTQIISDVAQVSNDTTQSTGDIFTLVDELHKVGGLNDTIPAVTTPTSIDAGTIHIDITGDGVTSTTLTRND